ncbi:MAG: PTS sugar transporter subunit IIB [Erysipelotrichaceae bacterium]|jgi:PTS system mannose-specific IIB component|nr:PTS sugar transporter subunit IIB [Erysipelotrichaceae bacterium]
MAIVDVRIDDRLIHGQVVGFWIPQNHVNKIVVIDDAIVDDEMRKSIMKLGTPRQVKLSVLSAASAADKLSRNLDAGDNVMLLCVGPAPLLAMAKAGYAVKKITVGNMSFVADSTQVRNNTFLRKQDIEDFKELAAYGIEMNCQITPDETPVALMPLLKGI